MSQNPNPFLRGYWNLKIVRTLSISHEDGSPHVWLNIHPSQHHLSDEALVSSPHRHRRLRGGQDWHRTCRRRTDGRMRCR